MITVYVPEPVLEKMLAQWEPAARAQMPCYRFAKCWGCGRTLFFGMWHIFFRRDQREAHLCRKCGRPYEIQL
jgi:hypothetical protein